MDTVALVVLIVCLTIIVVVLAAALWWQGRRSKELQERFGPEYERELRRSGSRNKAERELDARRQRVEQLNIRPLRPEQADRYREAWFGTQARFVDDPREALEDGERIIEDVMRARGYPGGDFEHRVADISVDHPEVAGRYRKAHGIARAPRAGVEPDTEQLRQALLDYRRLFMELLEDTPQRRAS